MKASIISTVALAACTFVGSAQADVKVAAVNIREAYSTYYKRFNVEEEHQKILANIRKEVQQRQEKLVALQEEVKALASKGDSSLSDANLRKIQEEYQRKMNELRAMETEFRNFIQRREAVFTKLQQDQLRLLFQDIAKAVNEVASKGDYDLVVNASSASTQAGGLNALTETFPYVKDSLNVTPEVVKILNADAPKDFDPEAAQRKLQETVAELNKTAEGAQAAPAQTTPAKN